MAEFYFTGKPCKRGHVANRYKTDGSCVECALLRATAHYEKNKSKTLDRLRLAYAENPEPAKLKAAAVRRADPDRARSKNRSDYAAHRAAYIARARKWELANPERARWKNESWRRANPAKVLHSAALSRAARDKRCPRWLTKEHERAMQAVYAEARRLTVATGIEHDVDHVVPMRGRNVSGLHVPWNLQVMTSAENSRKSNKFIAEVA